MLAPGAILSVVLLMIVPLPPIILDLLLSVLAGLAFRRPFRGSAFAFYLAIASLIMPGLFVGLGIAQATDDQVNVALPLAVGFWLIGLLFALWAAFPTLRYWDGLPAQTRWLGALPLLSVSLFLSAALIAVLFV